MLRFRRIGTTLLSTHLLMALVPLLLLGILSYYIAAGIIERQSFNQLEAVNANKQDAITRYFDGLADQIVTLAANPLTAAALTGLHDGFAQAEADSTPAAGIEDTALSDFYRNQFSVELGRQNPGRSFDPQSVLAMLSSNAKRLQHHYVAANPHPLGQKSLLDSSESGSRYDSSHARYHPVFRQLQQRFGLYDVFLVDVNGDVVYTVFKEIDFASNLQHGAYSQTPLGEVYRKAMQASPGESVLADFASYLPSYDAPASFIAAPVHDDGRLIGVVAFQIPIDRINSVMGLRAGMGDSGESYLIGPDQLMRSDSFLDPANHSVVASFRHPALGKVDTEASRQALAGVAGESIVVDYNGNPVLSVFAPLTVHGLQWAILSEMDTAEAFAGIVRLRNLTLLLGLAVAVLGALAAGRVAGNLARPIGQLCKGIEQVAAGSLAVDLTLQRRDELGDLCRAVQAMQEKLRLVIRRDIVELVKAASAGNLDGGIAEHDKSGFYLELAQALNRLMQINRGFLVDTGNALHAMRRGELDFAVPTHYHGRFAAVQQDIDGMRRTLYDIVCQEVQQVVRAAANGDLSQRVTEQGKSGCYLGLAQTVNRLVDINDTIISDTVRLTSCLAQGDLNARSERQYQGSFAVLHHNVQQLQTGLKRVIHDEIGHIVDAAVQGDLTGRIDLAAYQGFYRSLASAINELIGTCDQVLSDTSSVMSAMAQGDLCKRIERRYEGSFGQLRQDVNHSVSTVTDMVARIRQTVSAVDGGMREIAGGNMDLSARTENQAASLQETSAAVEQLTAAVRNTAINASAATQRALNAARLAEQGGAVVGDAGMAMDKLNEASARIAEITEVINGIAFQTNLLALNAAVEAARAGEHGQGFAVVANEVRILAGRSSKAAKEIEVLIRESELRVREGAALVHHSGAVLNDIIKAAHGVSELLEGMRTASDEQSAGLNEINLAVAQIDQHTQQNSALVEQTAAASEALLAQSNALLAQVSCFRIGPAAAAGLRQSMAA